MRLVDLEEKSILDEVAAEQLGIDIRRYDQRKDFQESQISKDLTTRRTSLRSADGPRYSVVYLLHDDDGRVDKVVICRYAATVCGRSCTVLCPWKETLIPFQESPSTNRVRLRDWVVRSSTRSGVARGSGNAGGSDGDVKLDVVKGRVDLTSQNAVHQIDGLSGATLTSNGVENLITYWLGDEGFGPVLNQLQSGAI